MEEIIIALLASPVVRNFIKTVAIEVIGELFHRRSVDPVFKAKSDEVFKQFVSANTEEEITNAQNELRLLMSSA